jgi:hypothetical protein
LIVNSVPMTLPATFELDVICMDGISVNLIYRVKKGKSNKVEPDEDEPDEVETDNAKAQNTCDKDESENKPVAQEDHTTDGKLKWVSDRRPSSALQDQHIVSVDPGVREVTYVLTPVANLRVLEHPVLSTLGKVDNVDKIFEADDRAKVRGNRQLSANVHATMARTKKHRAMEKEALRKVDKVLKKTRI